MSVRRLLAVVVTAVALTAAAACSGESDPARPTVQRDVPYADGLHADVYQPVRGPGPVPAVVLVHGGGFVGGTRDDLGPMSESLAQRGYAAVTVDYTLSTGNWFPASTLDQPGLAGATARATDDVDKAITWLRAEAGTYHIDPARIGVVGYSAGAITALAVAAHPEVAIDAAIAISGAAVDAGALIRPHSPLLLLTGDQDTVIPAHLADETCAIAVQGGRCDVFHYGEQGHDLPYGPAVPDVIGRIDQFLRQA